MAQMRWTQRDGKYFYIDGDKDFGSRTKGEVLRAENWGARDPYYLARLRGDARGARLDDLDDAKKYVETVVALKGD